MWIPLLRVKSIFLIGFGIGFTLALLFALVEDFLKDNAICLARVPQLLQNQRTRFPSKEKSAILGGAEKSNGDISFGNWIKENWLTEPEELKYRDWLNSHNVRVSAINMDSYVYGPANNTERSKVLKSKWLKSKVHVICVVFIERPKFIEAIVSTWGPRCNRLFFFGHRINDSRTPVINFSVKLTSSWQLLCEAMNYVWNATEPNEEGSDRALEWVIFVKDDTMVIPENLRYLVAPLDFNDNHYLGHPVVLWGQAYNIAQAGYALSKGAVSKIVEMFDTHQKCASSGKYWKKEDYYLGKHLASVGIHPSDTRDVYTRGTFHGYSLQILLWGVARSGSYWTRALYPPGPHCCSARSVTFSTGEPDKMYMLNYMLYNLHVFTDEGAYGNKLAPPSTSEDEIWKAVLRDEFNITDLENISSERYYEIWRERYSEPEQFIMKNYKNMPDILSSLLTAYESEKKVSDKSGF